MSFASVSTDILVVDLDGTLLRSDMLYESFWSAMGRDWRSPWRTLLALKDGRAALKRYLSQAADLDVATLPYDPDVLAYVKACRAAGQRTALVTATDQALADRIAAHLGIFDDVHGSDGVTNLKGTAKADFLQSTYAGKRFAYMGDSQADLEVWKVAALAIPVNIAPGLRAQLARLDVATEPLATAPAATTASYLRALRPHQWLKNILVFLPMLAGHQIAAGPFGLSLLAFVAFSLIASSVYVLNDLLDLRSDRAHPRKCKRPFAAGDIPIAHGTVMAGGLLLAGVVLSLALGPGFALVMAIYYLVTLAYSMTLKRRAIVDICVLAGLYTMRIVAGGAAAGIALSVWLLAFSIFFFFAMAAIKRQAELVDMAARGKLTATGRGYGVEDLPVISMMAVGAGYVSVMVLMLYVNSPAVVELYKTPAALWGICCVLLYWISRVVIVTQRGHMNDDPVIFAAKDRNSQICLVVMFLFAVAGALV